MSVNSHDFPEVYEQIGLGLNGLGCVMLDVEPLPVREALGDLPDDALYWSPDPGRWWIKGPVGQEGGHVTLLYGILKQLWFGRDGSDGHNAYFPAIDAVLADWTPPAEVELGDVLAWPDPTGGPSTTLVAEVVLDPAIVEAHQRLSLLPHIDTFLGYQPHVTLAYVRNQYAEIAQTRLQAHFGGELIRTTNLDYGHPA